MTHDYRDVSRFLQNYAKNYHAGAFGAPLPKDLAALPPENILDLRDGTERTVLVAKTLSRPSYRKDFIGTRHELPAGARVVSAYGSTPNGPIPDFSPYDYVTGYPEDWRLAAALRSQGRPVSFTNVTAASELVATWGPPGLSGSYSAADSATCVQVPIDVSPTARALVGRELASVGGWHDDYPFYSDGSWNALSLRGFRPDPKWGIKPAEMPKAWKQAHPDAVHYPCDWTVLADRCPVLCKIVAGVDWWTDLERVRLLRMEGRGGKGGALKRHSDITDRSAGTRDGQIARFHIPLVTDPRITMTTWDLDGSATTRHLQPWHCYYLDQRKPHAVTNPTGVDRVHLVVDVIVTSAVRERIAAGLPA